MPATQLPKNSIRQQAFIQLPSRVVSRSVVSFDLVQPERERIAGQMDS
jgi:hypothetical protein